MQFLRQLFTDLQNSGRTAKTGPFSECVRRTSASKTGPEMASNQKNSVTKGFAFSCSIYCPLATPRRVSQSGTMHSCTFRLCYLQRFAPKLKNGKQHWSSYQDTANLVCFLELLTTNQALIPCEDNGREGRSLTCSFLTHTMGEYTQRWRLKIVLLFLVVKAKRTQVQRNRRTLYVGLKPNSTN